MFTAPQVSIPSDTLVTILATGAASALESFKEGSLADGPSNTGPRARNRIDWRQAVLGQSPDPKQRAIRDESRTIPPSRRAGPGGATVVDPLSVCVNTQTPLIQFHPEEDGGGPWPKTGAGVDLEELSEGRDYRFSPGGVTRMVYPLVNRLLDDGVLGEAHWVSLNPSAPATARLGRVTLHNVSVAKDRMASYGVVKEAIWGTVHGLESARGSEGLFWTGDFSEYAYYNRKTVEEVERLDQKHDFDVFYVHDFQQLPVGQMLSTVKPKVFRWHIPFDDTVIPDDWREPLRRYFDVYDVMIVSTKGYLASLKKFGYAGEAVQQYPYVDPAEYSKPDERAVAAIERKFRIGERDAVALVVGRMDPMKGQDVAIRAFARIAKEYPRLKLVLAGNGSFSGSRGGLGLSKGDRWRNSLEALARELKVEDRVVFTGHVTQRELDSLYERCRFTILPSYQEGFGLVVVEAWLHERPTIVSKRAGIAELIDEGTNGLLFAPGEPKGLAKRMATLMDASAARRRSLGKAGRKTAGVCSLKDAERSETKILESVVEA